MARGKANDASSRRRQTQLPTRSSCASRPSLVALMPGTVIAGEVKGSLEFLYSIQRESDETWTIFRGRVIEGTGKQSRLKIEHKTLGALDLYREMRHAG